MEEIILKHARAAAISLLLASALFILFWNGPTKPILDWIIQFQALTGAFLGVLGAYFIARYTIVHKDKIDEKRTAIAFALSIRKLLFVISTTISKYDKMLPELNILDKFLFNDFSSMNNDYKINMNTRKILKELISDECFYFDDDERIFDFKNKTIILDETICKNLEVIIVFGMSHKHSNINNVTENVGLKIEEISQKLSHHSAIYTLLIKTYFMICKHYNIKTELHYLPKIKKHLAINPSLEENHN